MLCFSSEQQFFHHPFKYFPNRLKSFSHGRGEASSAESTMLRRLPTRVRPRGPYLIPLAFRRSLRVTMLLQMVNGKLLDHCGVGSHPYCEMALHSLTDDIS